MPLCAEDDTALVMTWIKMFVDIEQLKSVDNYTMIIKQLIQRFDSILIQYRSCLMDHEMIIHQFALLLPVHLQLVDVVVMGE